MKKTILLALLAYSVTFAHAQKADTNTNRSARIRIISGTAMSPSNDILGNLSSSPEFTTVLNIIKSAGLTETFKTAGPITFFAPTNEAFEKLPPGELDSLLLQVHKTELINLINYHIIQGKITSVDIDRQVKAGNGQASFKTLTGGALVATINVNRNIVLTDENGGQAVVSKFDIKQSNGVLHVVNVVLIPKSTL